MRDNLHRATKIIPATLAGDNLLVNLPGSDVIALTGRNARKTLIVTEVKIRLGAIVGDKHLAVLIGTHRAGVNIKIRVEFPQFYRIATRLKQCPKCC